MAAKRRKTYQTKRRRSAKGEISQETKKGLFVIFLFGVGILLALSYFGVAGALGDAIDSGSKSAVGFGRWFLPILTFAWGYKLLNPESVQVRFVHVIGALFVIIALMAFTAVVSTLDFIREGLLTPGSADSPAGWAGIALAYPVVSLVGRFATGAFMVLLFFTGIMLMFNVSIITLWEKLRMSFAFSARMQEKVQAKMTDRKERKELKKEVEGSTPAFDVKKVSNQQVMEAGQMDEDELDENTEAMAVSAAPKKRRQIIDIPLNLLESRKGKPTSGDIHAHKDSNP